MTGSDRAGAYADLLAALLAARSDPATARFDAEIAAAEAAGELDGATARNLRWWQRESLRGVGDHLGEVLPGLLVALVEAERSAYQTVEDSAASWAAATGGAATDPGDPGGTDDGEGGGGRGGGPDGGSPDAPGPGIRSGGRASREAVTTLADVPPPTVPQPVPPPAPRASAARMQPPAPSTGAPRQRLLVGGLTVLSGGARPGGAPAPQSL